MRGGRRPNRHRHVWRDLVFAEPPALNEYNQTRPRTAIVNFDTCQSFSVISTNNDKVNFSIGFAVMPWSMSSALLARWILRVFEGAAAQYFSYRKSLSSAESSGRHYISRRLQLAAQIADCANAWNLRGRRRTWPQGSRRHDRRGSVTRGRGHASRTDRSGGFAEPQETGTSQELPGLPS